MNVDLKNVVDEKYYIYLEVKLYEWTSFFFIYSTERKPIQNKKLKIYNILFFIYFKYHVSSGHKW